LKMNKLTLDKENKKILGVCAGLARWMGIDVNIVRLLFVITTLIGVGSPILIYIVLGLIIN
jgi:phage shock protein C